ncbi:hypothetical protein LT493_23465 [Streptomyces tricolor]|nr:hypothetical protein [Streptomyces tricolor]
MPALAPVSWTWTAGLAVQLVNGAWGTLVPQPCRAPSAPSGHPHDRCRHPSTARPRRRDGEWNHNPDNTKWSAGNGLTLRPPPSPTTCSGPQHPHAPHPGPDLHRHGPARPLRDADGDRAGLALLRDSSA